MSHGGKEGAYVVSEGGIEGETAVLPIGMMKMNAMRPLSRLWLLTILLTSPLPALAQTSAPAAPEPAVKPRHTSISAAIRDSLQLLMIEHTTRIAFQEKTRQELGGPFWLDYKRSIRWPEQWEDTDRWYVNYVGHPIHGAAAGLIWLDHGPDGDANIGDKDYWSSRGRATAYAAIYSLQFEVGPLSEASIGNVGMQPETTGWVDHVVTPAGALGVLVAEDVLDRYVVQLAERHVRNAFIRATLRMIFTPARSLANAAEMRAPWERDGRPLTGPAGRH